MATAGGSMQRLMLLVLSWAVAAVLVLSVSSGLRASPDPGSDACGELGARLLEHPAVAHAWARALRSSEPDAVARVAAMLERIRAAHGCTGEESAAAPELPPGHPPIDGGGAPGLPPGHPPIPATPGSPAFAAPGVVTI